MKKIIIAHIFILFLGSCFGQQKIVLGKYIPQSQPLSCWAASLSNISRPGWNSKNTIGEDFFWNQFGYDIPNLDTFSRIGKQKYDFRTIRRDSVLKWSSVEKNFSYKYSRPMIHSFKVEGRSEYHLVNIIGYEKNVLVDDRINRWLYVFDPKPNNKGNYYLKNFLTYQLIPNEAATSNLQGTSYQFVSNKFSPPLPIFDVAEKGVLNDSFNNCTPTDSVSLKIKSIFDNVNKEGLTKIGLEIGNLKIIDKPMDIDNYENTVVSIGNHFPKSDTASFQIVTQNNSKSKIIPFVEITKNGSLKYHTGIVVRQLRESCWVIDRLENIGFLNKISNVNTEWKSRNADPFTEIEPYIYYKIIYYNDSNRFVQFEKDDKSQFYDIDGFLNKGLPKIYSKEEFHIKLLKIENKDLKPNTIVEELTLPNNWNVELYNKYLINKDVFEKVKSTKHTKLIVPIFKY